MDLVDFGPDDAASIAEFVQVFNACAAVDAPWLPPLTPYRLQMEMRYGWDGETGRYFLARSDGTTCGTVEYFGSDYDNLEACWIDPQIAPEFRGRGWGRPLIAAAESIALAAGRPLVTFGGWDSVAARALAAATDYRLATIGVQRRQSLDGSDAQARQFAALRDEAAAAAAGYDVLRIADTTPEDLLPGVVQASAAINDAPLEDLEFEGELHSVERVRAYEQAQKESGHRFRRVIAVERSSGEVAGHTVVSVDVEQPAYAEQHDTAVLPEHRGHRLGLLLKAEMACWLTETEPDLRWVETANAGSNGFMIAVNERLGYRVVGQRLMFQRRLAGTG